MLPYLLGADLSSGCAILRVLHKEILASTAEHTAALHERFAKPVPCRDKTKLLLTLRQWLTNLKELQAAGSSPFKETVMQSLTMVTSGIRDLNNVHEITDLLAPNDTGKLYPAIERKAAGRAVMDADTRLNEGSAGAGKDPKGDHKGAYSASIPCKHFAKGSCAGRDKCRFSHNSSDPKSGGKGNKGKKANSERDRCKKCGKITNPPQQKKTCPENSSSSAQAVLTSPPVSSPPEVAPPGLSTPVNTIANPEHVVVLATILRDVLSPGGSSESTRGASPGQLDMWFVKNSPVFAARDQTKHLSIIVDSSAEVHLVCPAHKHFSTNVTKMSVPLHLETAGGDWTLDVIGDLLCGGIPCSQSVFSAQPEVRKMDISTRDVLKAVEC